MPLELHKLNVVISVPVQHLINREFQVCVGVYKCTYERMYVCPCHRLTKPQLSLLH